MIDIEKAISYGRNLVGKIRYSMTGSRTGVDGSADCSGFVYQCLRKAGGTNFGYVPSTETLHEYFKKNGFKLISENKEWPMKRGDIVIWGKKGYSAGAGGHVGICLNNVNWIECTAWRNLGVTVQDHDARWAMNGGPYFYVYRQDTSAVEPPKPSEKPKPKPPVQKPKPPVQKPKPTEPKRVPQKAKFTAHEAVRIRYNPDTNKGYSGQNLQEGDTVHYDSYIDSDGWRWVSYIGYSGKRCYVAVRRLRDNYRTGKCY